MNSAQITLVKATCAASQWARSISIASVAT